MTDGFNYAHRDTRKKDGLSRFVSLRLPPDVEEIRESCAKREIPTASDETLAFLMCEVAALRPARILELGTAVGCSSLAMHSACPSAEIITAEHDAAFYREACMNIEKCGAKDSITVVFGEAEDVISRQTTPFDFIFMDCAKAQYIKLLPGLKRILAHGGVLVADDVLLYGWASGEADVPEKRRMLARHIEEYLEAVSCDDEFMTCVLKVGDGCAVSVKKFD